MSRQLADFEGIPILAGLRDIRPILKGMSGDEKYRVTTAKNERLLLRVSDSAAFPQKRHEYDLLQRFAALDVPMPQPAAFGVFGEERKVYTLLTWLEGEEAEKTLPRLSQKEQYQVGLEAGRILRRIHSLPAAPPAPWKERYFSVIDARLDAFRKEGTRFPGWEAMLDYIESGRSLLDHRPQVFHHGDYHMGNLILSSRNRVSVIDWHTVDFDNMGDPWYEFNRTGTEYPWFASGQIDGYFEGQVPEDFWRLLAYYLSVSAITSIVWAQYFAPAQLQAILTMNTNILQWFDGMKQRIPAWYISLPGEKPGRTPV